MLGISIVTSSRVSSHFILFSFVSIVCSLIILHPKNILSISIKYVVLHNKALHIILYDDSLNQSKMLINKKNTSSMSIFISDPFLNLIYVKDYADAKFGCVPVACHFLCHYMPRDLPGRGSYTIPCPVVASFWVAQRDTYDLSACVMPDTDWRNVKESRATLACLYRTLGRLYML